MKKILSFMVVIVFTLLFSGCTNNKWLLMICEEKHYSGGCDEIKYQLEGYESQKECMESGIRLENNAGFECGYSCESDSGFQVCNRICNEKGCSN